NKKAAIELSVNMIVVTVLSLIVLGIGFYIVTHIFTTATEYKEKLDEQTKENIRTTLMQTGELISLPINKYIVQRGENDVIAVGLLNNVGDRQTFYTTISCSEALAEDETELCAENMAIPCNTATAGYCSDWIIMDTEEITLENREATAIGLFVAVPDDAPAGMFAFNFKVCTGGQCSVSGTQYGSTKKVYITVPE
ncbi:MAG: hypothetical protein AABX82_08715, partial [Nanoarchaeota archaeon]